MTRTRRGGPVLIGEIADEALAVIWERMRAHREATGQPMPSPHIDEITRRQPEEVR